MSLSELLHIMHKDEKLTGEMARKLRTKELFKK